MGWKKRVFILEDDEQTINLYRDIFKELEISIFVARDIRSAVKAIRKIKSDLMILDLNLPDGSGLKILEKSRELGIGTPSIIVSGIFNQELVGLSRELGAVCSISKPFSTQTFIKIVKTILEIKKLVLTDKEKCQFVYLESSQDGSTKYVAFDEGRAIEFASLNEERRKRHTICLSSQYGCRMGCQFCVTGTKLNHNVSNIHYKDMLAKISIAQLYYGYEYKRKEIIFAGEGEPSLNISNILKLIEKLGNEFEFRMSTVGLIKTLPKITENLAHVLKELQISIHFPIDKLRSFHIAIAKSNPLKDILNLAEKFANKSGKNVLLNYTIFKGINDSLDLAEKLAKLAKGNPFIVKLSKANPHEIYHPVMDTEMNKFEEVIKNFEVKTKKFKSRSQGTSSVCGHMAAEIEGNQNAIKP